MKWLSFGEDVLFFANTMCTLYPHIRVRSGAQNFSKWSWKKRLYKINRLLRLWADHQICSYKSSCTAIRIWEPSSGLGHILSTSRRVQNTHFTFEMLKLRKDSLKMYIEDNEEKNQNKLTFWQSMVFCYHNCSNVLWEKIVLVWGKKLRKKFANSRP